MQKRGIIGGQGIGQNIGQNIGQDESNIFIVGNPANYFETLDIAIDDWNEISNNLTDTAAFLLVKAIAYYPDKIKEAAQYYEPSILARYIISLSTAFNKFYHECNILNAEVKMKKARLILTEVTADIIWEAMSLLGIKCPEEM